MLTSEKLTAEASNEAMLSAVERWARARGLWWRHEDSGAAQLGYDDRPHLAPERWTIECKGVEVRVRWSVGMHDIRGESRLWKVSPHGALLWALVVEAGLRTGRCKRCRGRGTWDEWDAQRFLRLPDCDDHRMRYTVESRREQLEIEGWTTAAFNCQPDPTRGLEFEAESYIVVAFRTIRCPACEGTSKQDAGRHVVDAQQQPTDPCWPTRRARQAIETLTVFADQLQARDEPLGFHLAHMLERKREGTLEAAGWLIAIASGSDLPPGYRWLAAELGLGDGERIAVWEDRDLGTTTLRAEAALGDGRRVNAARKLTDRDLEPGSDELLRRFHGLLADVRRKRDGERFVGHPATVLVQVDGPVQPGSVVYMRPDGTFTADRGEMPRQDEFTVGASGNRYRIFRDDVAVRYTYAGVVRQDRGDGLVAVALSPDVLVADGGRGVPRSDVLQRTEVGGLR